MARRTGILRRAARRLLGRRTVVYARVPAGSSPSKLLAGQTMVVAGAGGLVGSAVACEAAAHGASLVLVDLDGDALARTVAMLPPESAEPRRFVGDLGDPSLVGNMRRTLPGAPHAVVLASGGYFAPDQVQEGFQANYFAPTAFAERMADWMIDGGVAGSIVYLGSLHERTPIGVPAYSAAKAALRTAMRELAARVAQSWIRVNSVVPGRLTRGDGISVPAFGPAAMGTEVDPTWVARAVVVLASDYFSRYTTGASLTVDAGLALHGPYAGSIREGEEARIERQRKA